MLRHEDDNLLLVQEGDENLVLGDKVSDLVVYSTDDSGLRCLG